MDSGDYDSEILPPNISPKHKTEKETVNKCGGSVIIFSFIYSFFSISVSIFPKYIMQYGKRSKSSNTKK